MFEIESPQVASVQELANWTQRQLQRIAGQQQLMAVFGLATQHVEPTKRYAGMIVLADGTDWNPGSGEGVYRYNGSAWVFMG